MYYFRWISYNLLLDIVLKLFAHIYQKKLSLYQRNNSIYICNNRMYYYILYLTECTFACTHTKFGRIQVFWLPFKAMNLDY